MAINTFDPHGNDDLTPDESVVVGADDTQITSRTGSGDQTDDTVAGADGQLASSVIREKLARIYAEEEPSATEELAEAVAVAERSPHQQFMYDLSTSGKDLAAIQTEWHNYYQGLSDEDKQVVWQEFYASQSAITGAGAGAGADDPTATSAPADPAQAAQVVAKAKSETAAAGRSPAHKKRLRDARSARDIQAAIKHSVTAGGKLERKHHLQSLLFGLGAGTVVLVIFLFGFFNEVFIAPFIQPSRVTASTPLIVNSDSVAPSSTPEVVIPKINVQIPVVYDQPCCDEATIQNALESGVVHYPTTAKPGQAGNAAFFGHSSNNIFNKGKYKFAFVLLRTLEVGDTFYLTYGGKVYAYKAITKKVVDPTEIGVLGPVPGQTATATLITCDPPGTTLKRLVIVGQQISPDPSGNAPAVASAPASPSPVAAEKATLPGNAPTLWSRFIGTPIGKTVVFGIIAGGLIFGFRRFNAYRERPAGRT